MTTVRSLIIVAVCSLGSLACATTAVPELDPGKTGHIDAGTFRAHVLMFDSMGRMRDPIGDEKAPQRVAHVSFRRLNSKQANDYIGHVIDEIRKEKTKNHGRIKLLFFFHGGLNSRAAALRRAANHIQRMKHDEPDVYPIFVNWQTSLYASYKDHLLWIRKGHDTSGLGLVVAPAQALSDIARTVAEAPVAYYLHVSDRLRSYKYNDADKIGSIAQQCDDPKLRFREGTMKTVHPSVKRDVVQSTFISPLTLIASGLIDAAGSSAWSTMIFTADRLFWSPREVHRPYDYDPSEAGSGGLSRFLDRLVPELKGDDEITIVAHSAGAVVANKLIANYGHRLPIMNLVYMAPACPIDELMPGGRLVQFLLADPRRRLYVLALHEKAELEEQHFLKIPPRGSLLVWLDEVIQPKSSEYTGMMLGRARNLRLHSHLIPCDVQDQIHITAFHDDNSAEPWEQPQMHGQFGSLPYWGREWWEPNIAGLEAIRLTRTPRNP